MIIKARPLTPKSFSPFGQVLMGNGKVPQRLPFAAKVENCRVDAKPNITYIHINNVSGLVCIEAMERHPYSHQLFVPLNGTRHLLAVCPAARDGEPYLSELAVFTAEGSQAVNYNAGVWHAPRTSIGGPGEFIMMRWDSGTPGDEEVRLLDPAIEINLA